MNEQCKKEMKTDMDFAVWIKKGGPMESKSLPG